MPLTPAQKEEIKALVASGQRLAAVKRFREITGVGLSEATQAISRLGQRSSPTPGPGVLIPRPRLPSLDPKVVKNAEAAAMAAIREGRILDAVKAYRQHTGLGLKDSKDAIDVLTLVHHSSGRVNPRVAKAVIAEFAAGRKQEALTVLMTGAGYDEPEARAFFKSLSRLGIGRSGCARGCFAAVIALAILIAAIAFYATARL